ncbi:MAG: hypothetical protein KBC98_00235 [Candidatus Pacebacteria bacterium]|nr:hypothetical protein [Candidatus Paceibacterota bacterium]
MNKRQAGDGFAPGMFFLTACIKTLYYCYKTADGVSNLFMKKVEVTI